MDELQLNIAMGFIGYYGAHIENILYFLSVFILYRIFKTKALLVLFVSTILLVTGNYAQNIFSLQGASANYSKTGELLSVTEPSFIYMLFGYLSTISGLIATVAFFVFAISLKSANSNNKCNFLRET